jgi:ferredoxin
MSQIPGLGIVRGMGLTLKRFFEPKATIRYPEVRADVAPKFRGRLQLLYDEYGTLKCETCFQCAQACPIECIDMGGVDTKGRYHIHWGAPETYGERRDESALRRSGRPVPDEAYQHFDPIHPDALEAILERYDHDPKRMLEILEATQAEYGHLPVAALKMISQKTGAWYAMIYGTASYYRHLRFEPPAERAVPAAAAIAGARAGQETTFLSGLDASLTGRAGSALGGPGSAGPAQA